MNEQIFLNVSATNYQPVFKFFFFLLFSATKRVPTAFFSIE